MYPCLASTLRFNYKSKPRKQGKEMCSNRDYFGNKEKTFLMYPYQWISNMNLSLLIDIHKMFLFNIPHQQV